MKKIIIINGPNLNLLGTRQPHIYGNTTFEAFYAQLQEEFKGEAELHYFQSNSEGALIDKIQASANTMDGLVINAGAYTHTSVAIHDALANMEIPKMEVHISNIHKRESFRHHSYMSTVCDGVLIGMGLNGYRWAIRQILSL